jgi:hypothetical protein
VTIADIGNYNSEHLVAHVWVHTKAARSSNESGDDTISAATCSWKFFPNGSNMPLHIKIQVADQHSEW